MNCGIEAVKKVLAYYEKENEIIASQLEERLTGKGLSIFDIKEVVEKHGFKCKCFKDKRLIDDCPIIMYSKLFKHYFVIEEVHKWYLKSYGTILNESYLFTGIFKLKYNKYYIKIYC